MGNQIPGQGNQGKGQKKEEKKYKKPDVNNVTIGKKKTKRKGVDTAIKLPNG